MDLTLSQTIELDKLKNEGFKYIAKSVCGQVWAYEDKPEKVVEDGDWILVDGWAKKCSESYDFVKWHDDEPFNLTK